VHCAQGGRKLTQFYREVRDIAGAAAPSLEKGRNHRYMSKYWSISQGLYCILYLGTNLPCRKVCAAV